MLMEFPFFTALKIKSQLEKIAADHVKKMSFLHHIYLLQWFRGFGNVLQQSLKEYVISERKCHVFDRFGITPFAV